MARGVVLMLPNSPSRPGLLSSGSLSALSVPSFLLAGFQSTFCLYSPLPPNPASPFPNFPITSPCYSLAFCWGMVPCRACDSGPAGAHGAHPSSMWWLPWRGLTLGPPMPCGGSMGSASTSCDGGDKPQR